MPGSFLQQRVLPAMKTIRRGLNEEAANSRPVRRSPFKWILWAGAACALAVLTLSVWVLLEMRPVKGTARYTLTIPHGLGLSGIASRLDDAHLIRNRYAFVFYVRLAGADRHLRAGNYRLQAGKSGFWMLDRLVHGQEIATLVTFPEGVTGRDMARILDERGVISSRAFEGAITNPAFAANYNDLTRAGSPEGFLFPDTYEIAGNATAEEIALMQIKRFRQVYTPGFVARQRALHMTTAEVITLASIIEREAKIPSERPLISAVFHNRLRLHRPLESCATVQYALGVHKSRLTYDDLKVNSPYNTYHHIGLPPGPIGNPGLDSIRAALYPASVSYLYFVARDDGSHQFSETYRQHLEAQRRMRQAQNR